MLGCGLMGQVWEEEGAVAEVVYFLYNLEVLDLQCCVVAWRAESGRQICGVQNAVDTDLGCDQCGGFR